MNFDQKLTELQQSIDGFNTVVDQKQTIVDGKVTSSDSALSASVTAKNNTREYEIKTKGLSRDALNDLNSMKSNLEYQDLEALALSKSETIVDVFIYDTSKDSDGGAWRKRCSKLSWYNEELNTTTRGSRREFPAVAVIVAENNKVTIYDGDDPTMPMWMILQWNVDPYKLCVYAVNGILAVGNNYEPNAAYGGNGLALWSFPNALLRRSLSNYGGSGWFKFYESFTSSIGLIDGYNNTSVGSDPSRREFNLISYQINDVAMTVLPDAPIDPATGLPIPTIAVATDGGVSIIHNDGTVADLTYQLIPGQIESYHVDFDKNGGIWWSSDEAYTNAQFPGMILWYKKIPLTDTSQTPNIMFRNASIPNYWGNFVNKGFVKTSYGIAINSDIIPLQLLVHNYNNDAGGMIAHVKSNYNTGYMIGDNKGTFLVDTDTSDLVNAGDLVTNGGFDTDTDWTKEGPWSISNGEAVYDATSFGSIYQSFGNIVSGRSYIVNVTIGTNSSGLGQFFVQLRGSQGGVYNHQSGQTYTFNITAGSTGTGEILIFSNSTYPFTISNISVQVADTDRSVKKNGLIVNGTITRSPVATGAELVGYSGFHSTSGNYLEQSYNSDLDFGTGDFSIQFWAYDQSWPLNAEPTPLYRGNNWYGTGENIFTQISLSKPNIVLGRSPSREQLTATTSLSNASWNHVAFVRSNGILSIYVNGKLDISASSSRNIVNTNAKLYVGVWDGDDYIRAGQPSSKFALLRISATAPTAEQIKKIYEDEKKLFQENAKCTLYGTSDSVTALAYDETTDLLHVGTSQGRSVFKGLQRVDNTTTPVTTAISAHNGLIVEQ